DPASRASSRMASMSRAKSDSASVGGSAMADDPVTASTNAVMGSRTFHRRDRFRCTRASSRSADGGNFQAPQHMSNRQSSGTAQPGPPREITVHKRLMAEPVIVRRDAGNLAPAHRPLPAPH